MGYPTRTTMVYCDDYPCSSNSSRDNIQNTNGQINISPHINDTLSYQIMGNRVDKKGLTGV